MVCSGPKALLHFHLVVIVRSIIFVCKIPGTAQDVDNIIWSNLNIEQDYRQVHLSGWHKRKIKKNPTKFQKVKKIPLTLKICKSAANAISFYSETPYLSIYVSETFTQKGKAQIKKRETCGPPLLLGVIKIQKRFGYIRVFFAFWGKLVLPENGETRFFPPKTRISGNFEQILHYKI